MRVRLLELQFTFRVEHALTDQVTVTFNSSEQMVECTCFLYSGAFKGKTYRTSIAPSQEYADRLGQQFLRGLT
jgi:hypothetical protein